MYAWYHPHRSLKTYLKAVEVVVGGEHLVQYEQLADGVENEQQLAAEEQHHQVVADPGTIP